MKNRLPAVAASGKFLLAAVSAVFVLSSTPASAAWSQHGTAFTPRGVYSDAQSGSCGGGSCSHTGSVTGPYGGRATNSGTVTKTGPGQYSSSGTVTGPNGNSVSHSASTNCANGTCKRSGTIAGPDGQSVSHTGSATRIAPGVVVTSGNFTEPHGGTVVTAGVGVVVGVAPVIPPPAVYIPPPAVYVPAPVVYVAPAPHVWIPAHWVGALWIPAHWS